MIQRAKDAQVVGIVVGTLGVGKKFDLAIKFTSYNLLA